MCEGIVVAYPCVVCPPGLVVTAGVLTVAATVGCVFGAMAIKNDNYFCVLILGSFLFDLIATIFLLILVPFSLDFSMTVPITQSLCALSVFAGAMYLIIDVYLVFRCKWYGITHEDYIFAAMIIYLDIIQLFLRVLKLLAKLKGDSLD